MSKLCCYVVGMAGSLAVRNFFPSSLHFLTNLATIYEKRIPPQEHLLSQITAYYDATFSGDCGVAAQELMTPGLHKGMTETTLERFNPFLFRTNFRDSRSYTFGSVNICTVREINR